MTNSTLLPDQYFSADQQQDLKTLIYQWRLDRDEGEVLSQHQQDKLTALIEAELLASAARTQAIRNTLDQ